MYKNNLRKWKKKIRNLPQYPPLKELYSLLTKIFQTLTLLASPYTCIETHHNYFALQFSYLRQLRLGFSKFVPKGNQIASNPD